MVSCYSSPLETRSEQLISDGRSSDTGEVILTHFTKKSFASSLPGLKSWWTPPPNPSPPTRVPLWEG